MKQELLARVHLLVALSESILTVSNGENTRNVFGLLAISF